MYGGRKERSGREVERVKSLQAKRGDERGRCLDLIRATDRKREASLLRRFRTHKTSRYAATTVRTIALSLFDPRLVRDPP